MEKIKINGVIFNDFGANNYSDGMHCITAYPIEDMAQFVQDVLNGEYPGVFLNPSADCTGSSEFFGVWGTPEQYEVFVQHQRESQIACRVIARYGGDVHEFARRVQWDPEEHKRISAEESANYKDWWL